MLLLNYEPQGIEQKKCVTAQTTVESRPGPVSHRKAQQQNQDGANCYREPFLVIHGEHDCERHEGGADRGQDEDENRN